MISVILILVCKFFYNLITNIEYISTNKITNTKILKLFPKLKVFDGTLKGEIRYIPSSLKKFNIIMNIYLFLFDINLSQIITKLDNEYDVKIMFETINPCGIHWNKGLISINRSDATSSFVPLKSFWTILSKSNKSYNMVLFFNRYIV